MVSSTGSGADAGDGAPRPAVLPEPAVQRRLREELARAHELQQSNLLARLRAATLVERASRLDTVLGAQHWLRSQER